MMKRIFPIGCLAVVAGLSVAWSLRQSVFPSPSNLTQISADDAAPVVDFSDIQDFQVASGSSIIPSKPIEVPLKAISEASALRVEVGCSCVVASVKEVVMRAGNPVARLEVAIDRAKSQVGHWRYAVMLTNSDGRGIGRVDVGYSYFPNIWGVKPDSVVTLRKDQDGAIRDHVVLRSKSQARLQQLQVELQMRSFVATLGQVEPKTSERWGDFYQREVVFDIGQDAVRGKLDSEAFIRSTDGTQISFLVKADVPSIFNVTPSIVLFDLTKPGEKTKRVRVVSPRSFELSESTSTSSELLKVAIIQQPTHESASFEAIVELSASEQFMNAIDASATVVLSLRSERGDEQKVNLPVGVLR
jgi:hypothetical protein